MGEADAVDEDPCCPVRLARLTEGGFRGGGVGKVAGDGESLDRFADPCDAHFVDVDGGDPGAGFSQMPRRLRSQPGCGAGNHHRTLP